MKLAIFLLLGNALAIISNPLPIPQNISWSGTDAVAIDPSMTVSVNPPVALVEDAFKRMVDSVLRLKWFPAAVEEPISSYASFPTFTAKKRNQAAIKQAAINHIVITIEDEEAALQLGVNETYLLKTDSTNSVIEVTAHTNWGALHALTTLGQIVFYNDETDTYYLELDVEIVDWPLYPHRGLLIDSGRNFLSVESIRDQIDILALSKMNVLHWHLADSQSWPIELESYPNMTDDAYSKNQVYSKQDLSETVAYAKQRGVRVVPEIDWPGHSRAGYLQLRESILACADSWWSNDVWAEHTAVEPPAGQLEILSNVTYEVVGNIYNELSEIFTDNVFHVGADELQAQCYNFSAITQEWFAANASRTYKDLAQVWIDTAVPLFNSVADRRVTMWEDIVLAAEGAHEVPKDIILQSWGEQENLVNLTDSGYDVIVSTASFLYLDCGYGGWVTNDPRYVDVYENNVFNLGLGGSWCAPYKTWQRIYDFDFTANLTAEQSQHILGAEAALWSEQADSLVLTSKIWPRTAALAESLWSGNRDPGTGFLRTNYLTQRILNFREYLVALGYAATPLVPQFCLRNPHACDLYKNQTVLDGY